jgi:hypothetical protein
MWQKTEHLDLVLGPDGQQYSCHYYGEGESHAVITGPIPVGGPLRPVPEIHREPVADAAEAKIHLLGWRRANGWPA